MLDKIDDDDWIKIRLQVSVKPESIREAEKKIDLITADFDL